MCPSQTTGPSPSSRTAASSSATACGIWCSNACRMNHPCRASHDPLKGAALAVRQSRPGGALGWTASGLKALIVSASLLGATAAFAQSSIVVASTTSTEQSGLFGYLLPEFKKATNIDVKVVALGTGQAIDMARRGDADVLFVHDKVAEEKFVA